MTGRVRVFACLLTVGILAAVLLSTLSVTAPPPIPMRTQGQAFDRAGAPLPIGKQTIPLLVDGVGQTSVLWMTPDIAVAGVLVRVDVQDPFGAQASDTRTVSLTRQSPLALIIAVLIAIVLGLFLLFGFLRARKKPKVPAAPPPTHPLAPAVLPPVGAATVTPGLAPDKKVCPRCHTHVNASDVTCFFCGYKFAEGAPPP